MTDASAIRYLCDDQRHLICVPYSIDGLHRMAAALGIHRCWFHAGARPHYDIPMRRLAEIRARCELVPPRDILAIIKAALEPAPI